jgi:hypothetical protein
MKSRLKILVFALMLFSVSKLAAQTIKIRSVEYLDKKVVLYYDLLDSLEGRAFSIRLYFSSDGYLNPLAKVSGDVGLEIKSGKNRKIVWALSEELPPDFSGKVALEIRGRLFIPFIQTESINSYKVFKRKRKYQLTWSGGTPQNVLNFDLMKGDKKITTFPNLANVGHHTFEFPIHIRPGKGYHFRISDTKNKDEVVVTNTFKIKRKIPLLVKSIPLMAMGYGISILTGKSPVPFSDDDIDGPPLIK